MKKTAIHRHPILDTYINVETQLNYLVDSNKNVRVNICSDPTMRGCLKWDSFYGYIIHPTKIPKKVRPTITKTIQNWTTANMTADEMLSHLYAFQFNVLSEYRFNKPNHNSISPGFEYDEFSMIALLEDEFENNEPMYEFIFTVSDINIIQDNEIIMNNVYFMTTLV